MASLLNALSEEKKLFASIIKGQGSYDITWWSRNKRNIERSLNKSFSHMKDCIENLNKTLDLSDAKQPERNYFFPIVLKENDFPEHEDATNEVEDPEIKFMPDQPDPPTLNNVEAETLRKMCAEKPELQMVFPRDDYAQAIELALDLQEFYTCYQTLYLGIFRDWYLDAEKLPSKEKKLRGNLAAAKKSLANFIAVGLAEEFPEQLVDHRNDIQIIEDKLAELEETKADLPGFLEKRGTLDQFKEAMRLKRDGIMDKVSKIGLNAFQVKILNDTIPQLELCCVRRQDDDRDYLKIAQYDGLKSTLERTVFDIMSERRRACDLKSTSDDLQSIRTELAASNNASLLNNKKMLIALMESAIKNSRKGVPDSEDSGNPTKGKNKRPT